MLKRRIYLDTEKRDEQFKTCLALNLNETYEFETENPTSWRVVWARIDKGGMEFQTFLTGKKLKVWRIV